MFGLFNKGKFLGFWDNRPGDIFLQNTLRMLNLNASETELHYYPDCPKPLENYGFDGLRLLVMEKSVVEVDKEVTKEVDGVTVTEVVKVSEHREKTLKILNPITYYANGVYVIPC